MVDRSFSDYYDTPENQIYLISAAGIAAVFAALGRLIKFPKIEFSKYISFGEFLSSAKKI